MNRGLAVPRSTLTGEAFRPPASYLFFALGFADSTRFGLAGFFAHALSAARVPAFRSPLPPSMGVTGPA